MWAASCPSIVNGETDMQGGAQSFPGVAKLGSLLLWGSYCFPELQSREKLVLARGAINPHPSGPHRAGLCFWL